MRPRYSALFGTVLLALVAHSCGGGSSGYPTGSGNQNPPPGGGQPPPATTTNQISVKNNRFDPASTTVNAGTTVTWTWDACDDDGYGGRTCIDHSVAFDGGGGSATQSTGTYSRQFPSAGTFNYRCTVHGSSMTGQIVVR